MPNGIEESCMIRDNVIVYPGHTARHTGYQQAERGRIGFSRHTAIYHFLNDNESCLDLAAKA